MFCLKIIIRNIIRFIIRAKPTETILDALDRQQTKIEKLFYRQKFGVEDLIMAIESCGVGTGDTIMVHAAWRKFYNFNGTPTKLLDILVKIVGDDGTIMMPCYGDNLFLFDVDNTLSSAGVLSETFRKFPLVQRSKCTHFSVAALGKRANFLIEEHEKSQYGFDLHSPCYKLRFVNNSKVLFLGLGKVPTKISVFHCAGSLLREKDYKLRKLLSNYYHSTLVVNGTKHEKLMYTRIPGHSNNNKTFKEVFKSLKKTKAYRLSNLDIVVIDVNEAINNAVLFAQKGQYCYNNMDEI